MPKMTKSQKQLLLANGFLAGLAELGETTLDSSNMKFERPFLKAWGEWSPGKPSDVLPRVEFGGTAQPRTILFRVRSSNSPFKDFREEGISPNPHNLQPREFLEIFCDELPPADWIDLARIYLAVQEERRERRQTHI